MIFFRKFCSNQNFHIYKGNTNFDTGMTSAVKNSSKESPELLRSLPVKRRKAESGGAVFVSGVNPTDQNGVSECFHKVSTSMYVSLAPVYTLNPVEGIKSQHLDPLIMSYFASAGGVVLAHYNLRLYGQQPHSKDVKSPAKTQEPVIAKIMYDSPFAFLWISVDLLVWKPVAGDVVEGWINLQSPSHIGLLIHDTFNATIKRDVIPAEWTFVPNQEDQNSEAENATAEGEEGSTVAQAIDQFPKSLGYWVDENGKKIDGKLKFTVRHFNVSGRTVSVQGTLLAPGTIREDLTRYNAHKDIKDQDVFDEFSIPATIGTESKKNNKHITFDNEDSQSKDETKSDEVDSSNSSEYEDAHESLDVDKT